MAPSSFPMATITASSTTRMRKHSIHSRWQPRPHQDDPNVKTHDFAYRSGAPDPTSTSKAIAAMLTILSPVISQPVLLRTLLLIFGGCCSNVYTLESILSLSSSTGTLITFLQFVFITLYTLPSQLTFRVVSAPEPPPLQPTQQVWFPRLKKRTVPLQKWMMFAAQFVMINVLNNAAFGYKISLPLHIILRSAGPVASMAVGYLWAGKRYRSRKVFSIALLFAGVVLAALSDAGNKPISAQSGPKDSQFQGNGTTSSPGENTRAPSAQRADSVSDALLHQAPGFALLSMALLLSAVMGIWSDSLYNRYGHTGKVAQEQLFYGHLLSLPFFFVQFSTLQSQYDSLLTASASSGSPIISRKVLSGLTPVTTLIHRLARPSSPTWQDKIMRLLSMQHIPNAVVYLVLNSITQIACISGVHHLSTQTSALTVSIVLNVRKVVSLLISIYLFGNSLPLGVILGAAVVFVGGVLYGIPDTKPKKKVECRRHQAGGETKKDR